MTFYSLRFSYHPMEGDGYKTKESKTKNREGECLGEDSFSNSVRFVEMQEV